MPLSKTLSFITRTKRVMVEDGSSWKIKTGGSPAHEPTPPSLCFLRVLLQRKNLRCCRRHIFGLLSSTHTHPTKTSGWSPYSRVEERNEAQIDNSGGPANFRTPFVYPSTIKPVITISFQYLLCSYIFEGTTSKEATASVGPIEILPVCVSCRRCIGIQLKKTKQR